MKAHFKRYTLNFKQASGTSRGILKTKTAYFIFLAKADGKNGIGECGLLKGLSADDKPGYEAKLAALCQAINDGEKASQLKEDLEEWPSILGGLEMALLDLDAEDHVLYPSAFTRGEASQAINGLIWMGDESFMKSQIEQRLSEGFSVLKMKIGAIDWPTEWKLLKSIRGSFSAHDLELRVDANGAFTSASAPAILDALAALDVHSIEQPLKKGQWQEMAQLCEKPAIPIALDEELIGVFGATQKESLLHTIKPQYIILKPSFLGGFAASENWIKRAEAKQIGWWVTSALESNVGLSAIAQWNYTLQNPMPSGLGTGSLYTNNFASPLQIKEGALHYNAKQAWQLEKLRA
jgi:o-succinylbenzoate synthase